MPQHLLSFLNYLYTLPVRRVTFAFKHQASSFGYLTVDAFLRVSGVATVDASVKNPLRQHFTCLTHCIASSPWINFHVVIVFFQVPIIHASLVTNSITACH